MAPSGTTRKQPHEPQQQRMFRQVKATFDFAVADRLRASLSAAGDDAGLCRLDHLQHSASMPSRTSRPASQVDSPNVVFVRGAELKPTVVRCY